MDESSSKRGFGNPTIKVDCRKKTGALALVQPGLTAGRQSGSPAGRQADEILEVWEIFKNL